MHTLKHIQDTDIFYLVSPFCWHVCTDEIRMSALHHYRVVAFQFLVFKALSVVANLDIPALALIVISKRLADMQCHLAVVYRT